MKFCILQPQDAVVESSFISKVFSTFKESLSDRWWHCFYGNSAVYSKCMISHCTVTVTIVCSHPCFVICIIVAWGAIFKEALFTFLAEGSYKQDIFLLNLRTRRILKNKLLCQMFKGFFSRWLLLLWPWKHCFCFSRKAKVNLNELKTKEHIRF